METSFFRRVAEQPHLLDSTVEAIQGNGSLPEWEKFSYIFRHIFPPAEEQQSETYQNVSSWLDVISLEFSTHLLNTESFTYTQLELLFRHFKLQPNPHVISFVGYLISIHPSIKRQFLRGDRRDDNVFGFMRKINFNNIRAVIMGQDPSPNTQSNGLAFHEIVCPSTIKLINYIQNELELVDFHTPYGEDLAMEPEQMCYLVEETCCLDGLIKQNVLLINARYTIISNAIDDFWAPITQFFVKQISQRRINVPFILFGKIAGQYKKFINLENHHVCELYHPNFPEENAGYIDKELTWEYQKPFITANIYLERKDQPIIEWGSVDSLPSPEAMDARVSKWRGFCSSCIMS